MLLTSLVTSTMLAFVPGAPLAAHAQMARPADISLLAGKGFGKATPPPPKKKVAAKSPKSDGQVRRDKAASDMDVRHLLSILRPPCPPSPRLSLCWLTHVTDRAPPQALKAQGLPEYMVMVREAPAGADPSKWYPVGGICVPRSSSETVALSMAIFNNEEDLLKGAFRSYPFLKQSPHPLEYGYRLKEFDDDPVKLAQKDLTEPSDNPLLDWFNTLDNPLNDGSGWFNPLNRKQ
jgi:hypothetical protein